jgi:hypothetical protein
VLFRAIFEWDGVDDGDGLTAEDVPGDVEDHPLRRLWTQDLFDHTAGLRENRFAHSEAVAVGDQHMNEAVLHEEEGELPDLLGEPLLEARRRDLREDSRLHPVVEALGMFPKDGVPLHVVQDRPEARDLEVPEKFLKVAREGEIYFL